MAENKSLCLTNMLPSKSYRRILMNLSQEKHYEDTSKNPNFVAIRRCSPKITPYISKYAASQFFARALSCLEL
jgi:hypothetical protein